MKDDEILIFEDLTDEITENEEEALPNTEELFSDSEENDGEPVNTAEEKEETKEAEPEKEESPLRPVISEDRTPVPIVQKEIKPFRTEPAPAPSSPDKSKRKAGRKRSRKRFPWGKVFGGIGIAALAAAIGAYAYGVNYYSERFLPGTVANGVSVENLTAEEAGEKISEAKKVDDRIFTLLTKEGTEESFSTEPLSLRRTYEGLPEAVASQNKWTFLFTKNEPKTMDFPYHVTCDDTGMEAVLDSLSVCDPEKTEVHVDSYVYQEEDGTFKVKEAFDGNEVDRTILSDAILRAVKEKENVLSISDIGAYITCDVREDDESLLKEADIQNSYENVNISIDMGADTIAAVSVSDFRKMTAVEDGTDRLLNEEAVERYMEKISRSYSTKSISGYRYFKSITGEKPVVQTDYGWEMDREATKEALLPVLTEAAKACRDGDVENAGKERNLTAVWKTEAISHGERDIGDTFVEVDLGGQKMYLVENGELVMESDIVSGKDTADRRTPPGIFQVRFKTTERDLVGYNPDGTESYRSHVHYWMPFNKNIGLHDATWRGKFGGTIYKYDGSHGCVNLPLKTAKELYGHVYKGMPVVVYK